MEYLSRRHCVDRVEKVVVTLLCASAGSRVNVSASGTQVAFQRTPSRPSCREHSMSPPSRAPSFPPWPRSELPLTLIRPTENQIGIHSKSWCFCGHLIVLHKRTNPQPSTASHSTDPPVRVCPTKCISPELFLACPRGSLSSLTCITPLSLFPAAW
jgi:hypothetical protein